jgi:hypothetical protein
MHLYWTGVARTLRESGDQECAGLDPPRQCAEWERRVRTRVMGSGSMGSLRLPALLDEPLGRAPSARSDSAEGWVVRDVAAIDVATGPRLAAAVRAAEPESGLRSTNLPDGSRSGAFASARILSRKRAWR